MCYRKGGKLQKRGKINLIGRLQLTTEKAKEEDNDSIVALRVLRVQVSTHQGYERNRAKMADCELGLLKQHTYRPYCGTLSIVVHTVCTI